MEVHPIALETLMQTGGELEDPLFLGNFKCSIPKKFWGFKGAEPTELTLEHLHGLLIKVVSNAVAPYDSVAVLLSGGVDSTSLLAYIKALSSTKPIAYHTDWKVPTRSETKHAEHAAKLFDTKLRVVDVSVPKQLKFLDEALKGTATADYSITAAYMVFKTMKENGIDVAVNGLGLDEYLLGYPIHRRMFDRMTQRRPHLMPFVKTHRRAIRYGLRLFGNDKAFFLANLFLSPGKAISKTVPDGDLHDIYWEWCKSNNLWEAIQSWNISHMFWNYATNIIRAGRAAGVEVIFPYLNAELADYCLRLPPVERYNKRPLRAIMEIMLNIPESLSERGWFWHKSTWDKMAWGGSPLPYIENAEFMDHFQYLGNLNPWIHQWAMRKFLWPIDSTPNRAGMQMMLFNKIMELHADE